MNDFDISPNNINNLIDNNTNTNNLITPSYVCHIEDPFKVNQY